MGQQQLLLLVLSIIIVGIASVVGLNAYSNNTDSANYDQLVQEAVTMASSAQAWKQKPEAFGGSEDANKATPADFTGLTYGDIGITNNASDDCYVSLNGSFEIAAADDGLTITGVNASNNNQVEVTVNGLGEANVTVDGDRDPAAIEDACTVEDEDDEEE